MDYRLDIYIQEDREHIIKYMYEREIHESQGLLHLPKTETVVETKEFVPPAFVLTLTPFHDIVRRLKSDALINPGKHPKFVEYEQVKVPKMAAVIVHSDEKPFVDYKPIEDDNIEGNEPFVDMNAVRAYAKRAIQDFRAANSVDIIQAGMNCDKLWTTGTMLREALA